jgi:hypothetical protein
MLPSMLAKFIPSKDANETEAHQAARIAAARAFFDAFEPRNPIQQRLALQAVSAHYAAMASFHIAYQADTNISAVRPGWGQDRCRRDR